MYPDVETLLNQAEDHLLNPEQIKTFKLNITSLTKRLETYEILRDKEAAIFQAIADQVLALYAKENPKTLEQVLKHWILLLRYCAMAMLLNDHTFLQHRILGWLKGLSQTYQTQAIETSLCQSLQTHLKQILSPQQIALLHPFLEQAQANLLESNSLAAP